MDHLTQGKHGHPIHFFKLVIFPCMSSQTDDSSTEYERLEVIFIKETRKGVLTNTYTGTVQYSPEELQ